MQILIRRTITGIGAVNISRSIRGPALENEVLLTATPEGVSITPFSEEGLSLGGRYAVKACFDQYNRIRIPQNILDASNLERNVIVEPSTDGTLLLAPDKGDCCILCGGRENLRRLSYDKLVCASCINKISDPETGGAGDENVTD